MKVALAQLNYIIGDFEGNRQKIIDSVKRAKSQHADLVVFAELAISGYPPRDFLEFDDFVQRCNDSIYDIATYTDGIGVIIGLPTFNPPGKGKKLRNSAAFLCNGEVESFFHKTLLPNYDVFDEYRYFEPNNNFEVLEYKGKKIAVTVCEDMWNVDEHYQYVITPLDEISKLHPDFIVNISASPFNYYQPVIRKKVLRANIQRYGLPMVYVNHVGAQTELLFDGNSQVMNSNGDSLLELKYFEEDFGVVDMDSAEPTKDHSLPGKIESIAKALEMGVQNYFSKLGFKKAIIGLSGGIDSAVTAVVAANALGKENVYVVLLPSQFSSNHSVSDAEKLAQNLGLTYDTIPIKDIYQSFEQTLKPFFQDLPFGLAEENIQARARGVVLMALSNKFGHVLLNTSNKSEAAVGYGTLYGDMNGGLSVLGDVYKSDVFAMAEYINQKEEIIPRNIISKPPSAELRPEQKDSDSLPDYEKLDAVLYQYIEEQQGPREIIQEGYEKDLVEKILRMVNVTEYKRHQTPPILRVSPKAFGMGRRMPIVAKYLA
ncbi:MAG: NAD+ synthase [Bacteroidales bacterium]|nr:NAD+ synthase [Bacteroidales bacterium]